MSIRPTELTADLHAYMIRHGVREAPVLRRLREETAAHPERQMQIAPEQGQFMTLLVRLLGATRTLEVGVFTGYSSLAVALALPEDGRVTACDVSEAYTSVARRYWTEAGMLHKIDLRLAPAADTLQALIDEGREGAYDFAFIDADKEQYDLYYERALQLVRVGGLIMLDNVFRGGHVVDEQSRDAGTQAMRDLNRKLSADPRIELCVLPLADGVTLALKQPVMTPEHRGRNVLVTRTLIP